MGGRGLAGGGVVEMVPVDAPSEVAPYVLCLDLFVDSLCVAAFLLVAPADPLCG